jgi:tRNA threonylcarbamoyladenosine biosynthesis protein TsaE
MVRFSEEVSRTDIPRVVEKLLQELPTQVPYAAVVGFSGELGAGKTTFTQELAKQLGVSEDVVSPTFVIMKRYATTHPVFTTLIHIDAYRLQNPEELLTLGFNEWHNKPHTLIVIEWPEHVSKVLPTHTIVRFSQVSVDVRLISW